VGPEAEEMAMNALEKWLEEGTREARKEALAEGLAEGQRATLRKQLAAKFGAVPVEAATRIREALPAELEAWTPRVLTATSVTAEVVEAKLDGAATLAVVAASDALYRLEKRLLDRFPREKVYVRAFFLDVAPARKKPAPASPPGTPGAPPPASGRIGGAGSPD